MRHAGFLLRLAWRDLRASGRRLWVFCACLLLGVALVAAGGGLYRQVAQSLQADARALFGGDVALESRDPLPAEAQAWMRSRAAAVSHMMELRTMLLVPGGRSHLVELQSVDTSYPLVGAVVLRPTQPLQEALARQEGQWGVALDGALAQRLVLQVGDEVRVGALALRVRAIIERQPDRSLRADWGAAPVLLAEGALRATGLVQPLSRLEYRWRIRTDGTAPAAWRDAFVAAFPQLGAEVRSFDERGDRLSQVLAQVGSGLLVVGFSALFIGGLGVFNSVHAWLQGKLPVFATLRALGLREAQLAAFILLQVLMLALLASLAGALLGNALAWAGLLAAAARFPLAASLEAQLVSSAVAVMFGVLTALTFALPALVRALSVSPAGLFRGDGGGAPAVPRAGWALASLSGTVLVTALLWAMPDPRLGAAFVAATAGVVLLLEGVVRGLRSLAGGALARHRAVPLELRLALAGLRQPQSPLRATLLSLGTALTLLVACTLAVAALLRALHETVPARAPALVMHDVQTDQLPLLAEVLQAAPSLERLQTAPLVLGRLIAVNGQDLRADADGLRARESRDEHKFSTRAGNIDDVEVTRGAWWPAGATDRPRVAMEDREADALGLQVGDQLRFEILGTPVEAELAAIYGQRRMQARLWLEAIFSDGVLDPFITRHVGAAWMAPEEALRAQDRLAEQAPNIASMRTETLLREMRQLLGRASAGVSVIAGICLAASLLVLASVVAATRSRRLYDATVMQALGARPSSLRRTLQWEYAVLAVVTALFSLVVGSALAGALLHWRMALDATGLLWTGALTAGGVSALALWLGARYLLARMQLQPAALLREER